jgi:hypothetical protein
MTPAMAAMFEHHGAALVSQLEATLGDRVVDVAEPALPAPRPDGVLGVRRTKLTRRPGQRRMPS